MTTTTPTTQKCPNCGQPLQNSNIYAVAIWRSEIMRATPPEVWAAYREDGINPIDAVSMEVSYGG